MNSTRRVMTVVGTRPELIKLARVIPELDRHFTHTLVHTGQNFDFELNQIFFDDLGIRKPDEFLNAARGTTMETIAALLIEGDKVLQKFSPDALLIYGDTNSCLIAYAAKRRKIPIFHMEAGNRCFDARVPEEINRRIIDHLADVNFVITEHARRYLLSENFPADRIIHSGSSIPEIVEKYRQQIDQSDILQRLSIQPKSYVVVSAHREENVDRQDKLEELLETLRQLAQDHEVIFSVHPRTRQRLDALAGAASLPARVRQLKPLGYFDYMKLQAESKVVLSDSGTLTEEAGLLGFPAVMIRDAHERPEGMDEGVCLMASTAPDRILSAMKIATSARANRRIPKDYKLKPVGSIVAQAIESMIDQVRRVVWSA
ncbi:MAG TPA: UDP-N-acetylglucosamine 2-epimerase (non-hydrolyzing) [Pseudobdellovibrionaceae bacterium]|nr:UDP-N-acetylglucosamine 2-epimerase (non-hydrolyzing) [Pseudobdellovibrionaceae bacterium]